MHNQCEYMIQVYHLKKKVDKSAHGQSKILQKQYIQEIFKNELVRKIVFQQMCTTLKIF